MVRSPDFVSIDIDSADIWVFETLARTYRPRVISIEANGNFPESSNIAFPDPAWMPLAVPEAGMWSGSCYYGSSIGAIHTAAAALGYKVVNATLDLDLFLVRADAWSGPSLPRHTTARVRHVCPKEGATASSIRGAFSAPPTLAAHWIDFSVRD